MPVIERRKQISFAYTPSTRNGVSQLSFGLLVTGFQAEAHVCKEEFYVDIRVVYVTE